MRPLRTSVIGCAALAMMTMAANAQTPGMQQGMQMGNHATRADEQTGKVDPNKYKANDKAYNAALKNLPDKQYDPWHGVR